MTHRESLAAFIAIACVTASAAWVIDTNNQPAERVVRDRISVVTAPPVTVEVTRTVRAARSATRVAPTPSSDTSSAAGSTGPYQSHARSLVSSSQWPCLRSLWQRESGWNPKALGPVNPNGKRPGGIPQILGMPISTPWQEQIDRGLSYIEGRYGSPCAAWAAFGAKGWY